jgi:dihydrofolate reductase
MGATVIALSMSLDGYVAGPGDDVERLHEWLFGGDQPSRHGHGLTLSETSRTFIDEFMDHSGATVVGRTTFELAGRWGGKPPFPMPFFVVSHEVPPEFAGEDAPFTFVTDGVERAIEQARAAAGDKYVSVMGADVPQQAIRAGVLDEIVIHLVPVLLGGGKRLFEHLGAGPIELERTKVVEAPEGVTHLRFRVRR